MLKLVVFELVAGFPFLITDFRTGAGEVCMGLPLSDSWPGLLAHGVNAGKGTPPVLVL